MSSPNDSLSSPERIAVTLVVAAASDIVVAYGVDRIGLRFLPWPMLLVAIVAGAMTWRTLKPRATAQPPDPPGTSDRAALVIWTTVVVAAGIWLAWLARPDFMPLSRGPDLTHHLLLIDYIERHWHLVHDASLAALMGEMAQYTPGSHLLAAFAGAWSRTDGLRALHGLLALTVALKAGFLFLIAMRVLPPDAPRRPLSAIAVLLTLAAPSYALGSFTEFGFVAQVVAELFAVALWWLIVVWAASPDLRLAALFAVLASAAFLTWPVYVGPPILAFAVSLIVVSPLTARLRLQHAAVAFALPAVVSGIYMFDRLGWLRLAGTSGFVPFPSIGGFSAPLLVLAGAGILTAGVRRRGGSTILFAGALALQTAALFVLARRSGADRPYMALKMFYLLLWPMTVFAAIAIGELWVAIRKMAVPPRLAAVSTAESGLAWLLVAVIAVLVARPLVRSPARLHPARPAVSLPLYDAGRWARANLSPACFEYLVGDDETAYWLHLAVLGNPRMTRRSADNSTYEPRDAVVRWLSPGGLPYAIADLPSVPRDVRNDFEIVRSFGTAAVVRRRGASTCADIQ